MIMANPFTSLVSCAKPIGHDPSGTWSKTPGVMSTFCNMKRGEDCLGKENGMIYIFFIHCEWFCIMIKIDC